MKLFSAALLVLLGCQTAKPRNPYEPAVFDLEEGGFVCARQLPGEKSYKLTVCKTYDECTKVCDLEKYLYQRDKQKGRIDGGTVF